MKYFILPVFLLVIKIAECQTFSKVISDSEIISFIDNDILKDSFENKKCISRELIRLELDIFYYKDSADYVKKNQSSRFIFYNHKFRDKEYSNQLDRVFSRKDIDFFYTQIMGQKKRLKWRRPFLNSKLVNSVELDSNRYAKQTMYTYSLPLFSFDKRKVLIIKGFFCGFLCGGGAYYIYERDNENKWQLIRMFNEWGE